MLSRPHGPQKFTTSLLAGLTLASAAWLTTPATASEFADSVETTHGGDHWNTQAAVAADIVVNFGGQTLIDGRMITDTPVGQTRFELKDGTVLVFDGKDAWTSPADSKFQGTRFHVLTWPYFLAAPMKLDDPGSHLKDLGKRPFRSGKALDAARLTFDSGVGDSPDDWYVAYRDGRGRLAGMAYIVTFGKSTEDAEKEPHAISYHDYREVDGVVIPTRWQFWNWSEKDGIFGDPIGSVQLSNLGFISPGVDTFTQPKDARKEVAPN